ncbi:MAG: hypothetical protein IT213_07185 [Cytophagales bacterium]|jgi:AraC family transcriptional activator of pobA|nr:hypothetical protein [Cytophagales bacterium]HMR56976.1 hypothetical protein [Cyclobacteriaceae bacterium]
MTASEWIQRHARERIIILLQSKRYTIAEIADETRMSKISTNKMKDIIMRVPDDHKKF